MSTGYIDRFKGKIFASADSRQAFGRGTASSKGGGNIYANASVTGFGNTSDTTSDILDTYTLPANSLYNNFSGLNVYAWGTTGGNAHTKSVVMSFGSESVTATTTGSTQSWVLEMNILKAGTNQQVISTQAIVNLLHQGTTAATGAESDSAGITIKVTGSTSVSTANDVVMNGWYITGYYF